MSRQHGKTERGMLERSTGAALFTGVGIRCWDLAPHPQGRCGQGGQGFVGQFSFIVFLPPPTLLPPSSTGDLPVSASPELELQCMPPYLAFYMGARDQTEDFRLL